MSVDVPDIRRLIEKHGAPLSPMLIFTLLDEIERQQVVIDAARAWEQSFDNHSSEGQARTHKRRVAALIDAVRALDEETP